MSEGVFDRIGQRFTAVAARLDQAATALTGGDDGDGGRAGACPACAEAARRLAFERDQLDVGLRTLFTAGQRPEDRGEVLLRALRGLRDGAGELDGHAGRVERAAAGGGPDAGADAHLARLRDAADRVAEARDELERLVTDLAARALPDAPLRGG
jgi:hypothetical protein